MAAYHSPCSLVGGRERIYVDFRLSRHWAPHDSPPHSLTPKARSGSGQRGSPIHPTVNAASIRWLASTSVLPAAPVGLSWYNSAWLLPARATFTYPGQGRPNDALGFSPDKTKPEGRPPGRSTPSTQENIHPERKKTAHPKKDCTS